MRAVSIAFVAAVVLALTGCMSMSQWSQAEVAGIPVVTREVDDLQNPGTIYRYNFQDVPSSGMMGAQDSIYLGYDDNEQENYYFFGVDYVGDDWRFMDGQVDFSVNGEFYTVSDPEPSRNVSGSLVSERIWAQLSPEHVEAIADASSMRIQYYGEPFTVSDTDLENMQILIDHFSE